MATRILIIRHGETIWNVERRIQGSQDIALTERGRQQAQLLAKRLSAESIKAIYSSPLVRAWETAETVAAHHTGINPIAQPELAEFSFGPHEGRKLDQVLAEVDEEKLNFDDDYRISIGAEPKQPSTAWAQTFFPNMADRHSEQTILLSTHGAKKRHLLDAIFPDKTAEFYGSHPENCSLTIVHWHPQNGPSLELLYDASHLEGQTFG